MDTPSNRTIFFLLVLIILEIYALSSSKFTSIFIYSFVISEVKNWNRMELFYCHLSLFTRLIFLTIFLGVTFDKYLESPLLFSNLYLIFFSSPIFYVFLIWLHDLFFLPNVRVIEYSDRTEYRNYINQLAARNPSFRPRILVFLLKLFVAYMETV